MRTLFPFGTSLNLSLIPGLPLNAFLWNYCFLLFLLMKEETCKWISFFIKELEYKGIKTHFPCPITARGSKIVQGPTRNTLHGLKPKMGKSMMELKRDDVNG